MSSEEIKEFMTTYKKQDTVIDLLEWILAEFKERKFTTREMAKIVKRIYKGIN